MDFCGPPGEPSFTSAARRCSKHEGETPLFLLLLSLGISGLHGDRMEFVRIPAPVEDSQQGHGNAYGFNYQRRARENFDNALAKKRPRFAVRPNSVADARMFVSKGELAAIGSVVAAFE